MDSSQSATQGRWASGLSPGFPSNYGGSILLLWDMMTSSKLGSSFGQLYGWGTWNRSLAGHFSQALCQDSQGLSLGLHVPGHLQELGSGHFTRVIASYSTWLCPSSQSDCRIARVCRPIQTGQFGLAPNPDWPV